MDNYTVFLPNIENSCRRFSMFFMSANANIKARPFELMKISLDGQDVIKTHYCVTALALSP